MQKYDLLNAFPNFARMNHEIAWVLTEYFPGIRSLQYMINSGSICIEGAENYQKNSLRNRCYLTGDQGKYFLSVPLMSGKNQKQAIRDVRISYDFDWMSLHLKTIRNSYSQAPFFEAYFPKIEKILRHKSKYLIDLNWATLSFALDSFHWDIPCSYTILFEQALTATLHPSLPLPRYPQLFEYKTDFVPDLCILDLLFCMGPERKYLILN